jgi:hypothetical protein
MFSLEAGNGIRQGNRHEFQSNYLELTGAAQNVFLRV